MVKRKTYKGIYRGEKKKISDAGLNEEMVFDVATYDITSIISTCITQTNMSCTYHRYCY